jgi:hypothetical protein
MDKGAVVEGVKRVIHGPDPDPPPGPAWAALVGELRRELLTVPPNDFAEGVHAEKHLREDICPSGIGNPLGPYIPAPRQDGAHRVGGEGRLALFEEYMLDWFDEQTPETLSAITVLARRQVRRTIIRQIVKENWIRAVAAGGFVGGAVQWGADILGWVRDHIPLIQGIWRLVKTGVGP